MLAWRWLKFCPWIHEITQISSQRLKHNILPCCDCCQDDFQARWIWHTAVTRPGFSRRLHNAIHPINHCPGDNVTHLSNNPGQPSKPNLRKSWIVRQEANSIFFNIYTENRGNISFATKMMQWNKRKQFFLGITVTKIMDKVKFAVTFGAFAHPPNRKDVLGGKGWGKSNPYLNFKIQL